MNESGDNAIRVLLVDDREAAGGLSRIMNGNNARIVMKRAYSSPEALRAVAEHRPDVVLLHLGVNGQHAFDLMDKLRDRTTAKLVVLADMRDLELRRRAVMQGAHGVAPDGGPPDVIIQAIERVHDRRDGAAAHIVPRIDGERHAVIQAKRAERKRRLTGRERWIVSNVVKYRGAPNKVIADALHISPNTLRNHLASIYAKLGIRRRLELVLYAMEKGLDGNNTEA